MKKSVCLLIRFLSCYLVFYIGVVAQPKSEVPVAFYGCGDHTIGFFRQDTGSRWRYNENGETGNLRYQPKTSNDRLLSDLEKIDPAYMFDIKRGENKSFVKVCPNEVAVFGGLVAPDGRYFEFKEAIFDNSLRRLKFRTVERDGIVYNGEAVFFVMPVRKIGYVDGRAKLTATGRSIGELRLEFDFGKYSPIEL